MELPELVTEAARRINQASAALGLGQLDNTNDHLAELHKLLTNEFIPNATEPKETKEAAD